MQQFSHSAFQLLRNGDAVLASFLTKSFGSALAGGRALCVADVLAHVWRREGADNRDLFSVDDDFWSPFEPRGEAACQPASDFIRIDFFVIS